MVITKISLFKRICQVFTKPASCSFGLVEEDHSSVEAPSPPHLPMFVLSSEKGPFAPRGPEAFERSTPDSSTSNITEGPVLEQAEKSCKKCVHYEALSEAHPRDIKIFSDYIHAGGTCMKPSMVSVDRLDGKVPNGEAGVWNFDGMSAALVVTEDFYCKMFEEKEEEIKLNPYSDGFVNSPPVWQGSSLDPNITSEKPNSTKIRATKDVEIVGVKKGDILYIWDGPDYGCLADGIAVTREENKTPFIEIPKDAFEYVNDKT